MKKYQTFLSIFIIYILVNMTIFPSLYISRTLDGLSAWAFNVLPSVLPFIFFIKILTSFNILEKFTKIFKTPCQKLFKTPASSSIVFFTSIISGYPVGAKMTAELFENGKISKSDAFKMCSFCSTSGPMFIIGTVGITLLGQAKYGYIIFLAHILGALINGILYRNLKLKEDEILHLKESTKETSFDFSSIILDSALSMIVVGAIIAIFFVIITSLSPIFNLFPIPIANILEGMVEITKGCIGISSSWHGKWAIAASTFVISFGGISTILQSLTMLSKLKMPIALFILQKLTHAIIACLISIIIILFI